MSQNPARLEGHDYLYQRGRRYVVRVQVPHGLRPVIGQGEFKRSLGGDLLIAKRKYHAVVAEFLGKIDAARRNSSQSGSPTQPRGRNVPGKADIEAACYDHFRLMVTNLRGKVLVEVGESPISGKSC